MTSVWAEMKAWPSASAVRVCGESQLKYGFICAEGTCKTELSVNLHAFYAAGQLLAQLHFPESVPEARG
jgi:hypothetical protein